MSPVLLYVFPLLLGRTIDINQMQVGIDIFPEDQLNNPRIIDFPHALFSYKRVDDDSDARSIRHVVSSHFGLNAKSGLLKSGVLADYLQDKFDRRTTVEILQRTTYLQIIKALRPTTPLPSWHERQGLGTHYVENIVYGTDLITSIRVKCNDTRFKERLIRELSNSQIRIGSEENYTTGFPEIVDSVEIKVFSSVPFRQIPKDMASLKTMLNEFRRAGENYNNGDGVPIEVNLRSLGSIYNGSEYSENSILFLDFENVEHELDSLLATKAAINDWMKILKQPLSEEDERRVGELYGNVLATIRVFYDAIGKLDLTGSLEQHTELYSDLPSGPVYNEYLRLRREIESQEA